MNIPTPSDLRLEILGKLPESGGDDPTMDSIVRLIRGAMNRDLPGVTIPLPFSDVSAETSIIEIRDQLIAGGYSVEEGVRSWYVTWP